MGAEGAPSALGEEVAMGGGEAAAPNPSANRRSPPLPGAVATGLSRSDQRTQSSLAPAAVLLLLSGPFRKLLSPSQVTFRAAALV